MPDKLSVFRHSREGGNPGNFVLFVIPSGVEESTAGLKINGRSLDSVRDDNLKLKFLDSRLRGNDELADPSQNDKWYIYFQNLVKQYHWS